MSALRLTASAIGIFAAVVAQAQIVTFEFSGLSGNEASANSNFIATGLNLSTLTRGTGVTASANADRFNAVNWPTGALDATKYFEFTIAAQTGYEFSITSIDVTHQRSGTGPVSFALRANSDNYASNLGTFAIGDVTTTQTNSFSSITLTNLTTTTFRIYGFSAEGTTGTWGIGDSSPANANDLVINGSVSAVPEPSTYAAMAGAVALIAAVVARRRREARGGRS